MTAYIQRKKQGKGFQYTLKDVKVGKEIVTRIASLAIPPAWSDVQISVSERAKVQATGYDINGKKQYIYSAKHTLKQELAKFDRITQFGARLPKLRKLVEKDIQRRRFDKKKVLAAAVSLIDEGYFRVGNQEYARKNQSYGLTTLRSKHVTVKGQKIIFDFIGKSGQEHHKVVEDGTIARIIRKLDDMPGYELFRYYDKQGVLHTLTSADVNEYIKQSMGYEFSAKDFRTWGGTLLAATELARVVRSDVSTARKKAMTECVKVVSSKLGNTPAIARKSYIDPRIFAMYDSSDGIGELYETMKNMKPKRYVSADEQWVLRLLKK